MSNDLEDIKKCLVLTGLLVSIHLQYNDFFAGMWPLTIEITSKEESNECYK